jgi:hypothetical protein
MKGRNKNTGDCEGKKERKKERKKKLKIGTDVE